MYVYFAVKMKRMEKLTNHIRVKIEIRFHKGFRKNVVLKCRSQEVEGSLSWLTSRVWTGASSLVLP